MSWLDLQSHQLNWWWIAGLLLCCFRWILDHVTSVWLQWSESLMLVANVSYILGACVQSHNCKNTLHAFHRIDRACCWSLHKTAQIILAYNWQGECLGRILSIRYRQARPIFTVIGAPPSGRSASNPWPCPVRSTTVITSLEIERVGFDRGHTSIKSGLTTFRS